MPLPETIDIPLDGWPVTNQTWIADINGLGGLQGSDPRIPLNLLGGLPEPLNGLGSCLQPPPAEPGQSVLLELLASSPEARAIRAGMQRRK
jgi:hypothetical protein